MASRRRGAFRGVLAALLCAATAGGGAAWGDDLFRRVDGSVLRNTLSSPSERAGEAETCAFPIRHAKPQLERAGKRASEFGPPAPEFVPPASATVYPLELARDAAAAIRDPEIYRVRAGKVTLEFLTPPFLAYLAEHSDPIYNPGEDYFEWLPHAKTTRPVVIVHALPDLRWTAGSAWRVAGYPLSWVAFPVMLLFALLSNDEEWIEPYFGAPPRAAYRFRRDLNGVEILRDGGVLKPIESELRCETRNILMSRRPGQKPRHRKVRGCHGFLVYAPGSFAPGGGPRGSDS
jgi:hypothetical protein